MFQSRFVAGGSPAEAATRIITPPDREIWSDLARVGVFSGCRTEIHPIMLFISQIPLTSPELRKLLETLLKRNIKRGLGTNFCVAAVWRIRQNNNFGRLHLFCVIYRVRTEVGEFNKGGSAAWKARRGLFLALSRDDVSRFYGS